VRLSDFTAPTYFGVLAFQFLVDCKEVFDFSQHMRFKLVMIGDVLMKRTADRQGQDFFVRNLLISPATSATALTTSGAFAPIGKLR